MALNKTPSSHRDYFSELNASGGRQSNFPFPVRIKMTPNTSVRPLSDSKKNSVKMMQPVLIKDLFQSTQKNRQNSTLVSVSTQKKKAPQRSNQPYLNTQSCYRPKKNQVEESTLFDIKSSGGSKVRRQLYQTFDSPQKFGCESKENTNKNIKQKKVSSKNLDETVFKSDETTSKPRKSYLMPPNTIRNSFLKTGSNLKTSVKQTVKDNTSNVNKSAKNASQRTDVKKQSFKLKNNSKSNSSKSVNSTDDKKPTLMVRDNYTTMTPMVDRKAPRSKPFNTIDKFERPTVIISPSRKQSSKLSDTADNLCLEVQNLSVNRSSSNCTQEVPNLNATQQIIEFDFAKMSKADENGLMQLKPFLEQSLQICESQASQLKQSLQICENQASQLRKAIDCINQIFIKRPETEDAAMETNTTTVLDNQITDNTQTAEKLNLSYTISVSDANSSTISNNKSFNTENHSITEETNVSTAEEQPLESPQTCAEKKLPIPIKIFVDDADLQQETENETARLSTIGEVSCELSCEMEMKKDEKYLSPNVDTTINYEEDQSENKKNVENSTNTIVPQTPRTPKARRSSSVIDGILNSQRRRSARLAAKSMSQSMLSDSDKQDSFTLLENELNVVHNAPPSKSLPASPMKAPATPSALKQWDKRIERPLKEYMALKMNGTFLVTPDVKRFQSCLEPTDTPHSRKSLSRKIFLELCDLYAESPERN